MKAYRAFAFRQNESAPLTLVFVAPSCEIDEWAKVPTRLSNNPTNFQRAAIPAHVHEINRFFSQDQSHRNSSPTSVLLGVDPTEAGSVVIVNSDGSTLDEANVGKSPVPCEVQISHEEWDESAFSNVDEELDALFEKVGHLYQPATTSETDAEDEDSEEDANADSDENQQEVDDGEFSLEDGAEKFLSAIPPDRLYKICANREYLTWDNANKRVLRDLFKDDLKPCLIIDGQHRIKGTRELENIPFSVSMLPRADWAELAFQFIVNNSSAKKVDENLLFGIVGQSLTQEQLELTETRLNRSGIKVSLIKAAMRVQMEPNPFLGMIRTNTPGERGFIDATALQKKVIEVWFGSRGRSGTSPSFKSFCAINDKRKKWSMGELFGSVCAGTRMPERARDWQENHWFKYFKAFWEAVSEHFSPRLWPQTKADWLPNDTLPQNMTPPQQERQKLMRATVLGLLQKALLQAWADHQNKNLRLAGKSMSDLKVSPEEFKQQISAFVKQIQPDFFTELKFTGFDASGDLRDEMTEHFLAIIEMNKSFADIKTTRFWRNN